MKRNHDREKYITRVSEFPEVEIEEPQDDVSPLAVGVIVFVLALAIMMFVMAYFDMRMP